MTIETRNSWAFALVFLAEACTTTEAREPARRAASPNGPCKEPSRESARTPPPPPLDPSHVDHSARGVIVVLGSSTAAGLGPADFKNTWVSRYRAYLAREFPSFTLTNLAVSGYTTYHVQASDFTPPVGRPNPDTAKNISAALALTPSAIIINLPSNDQAKGYPLAEQLQNFERLEKLARGSGVPLWVTSTQPRNLEDINQRLALITVKDALKSMFPRRSIDFFSDLAGPDASIRPEWDSGDGVHLNDAAHALLAVRVIASRIPETVIAERTSQDAPGSP